MIPQQSTWATVGVGDYIKDANGKTWKVTHTTDFSELTGHRGVTIRDRDGAEGTIARPDDGRPVVKMIASPDEQAIGLVRSELGGQTLGTIAAGDTEWRTPEMADLDWARRHMLDMHHVDCTDSPDLERVLALHGSSPAAVPHSHDHALKV